MAHKFGLTIPYKIDERSFILFGGTRWHYNVGEAQIFELGVGFRSITHTEVRINGGACFILLEEGQLLKLGGWL